MEEMRENSERKELDAVIDLTAIKLLILSCFGLSLMPAAAVLMQCIDIYSEFTPGSGTYAEYWRYMSESPLIFIVVTMLVFLAASVIRLMYSYKKGMIQKVPAAAIDRIAVKLLIGSCIGMSLMPAAAVLIRFIDTYSGFSQGSGYHTEYWRYMSESPLIFIVITMLLFFAASVIRLIVAYRRKHG